MENEKKYLIHLKDILINGGSIFLVTGFIYYFVTLKVELTYNAMGIPSQFIEFPFYEFVKQLDDFLLITLPSVYFATLFVLMILPINEKKKIRSFSEKHKKVNVSKKLSSLIEKILPYIILVIIFSILVVRARDANYILHFMHPNLVALTVFIGLYAIYQIPMHFINRKIGTKLNYEKIYQKSLKYFILLVVYGHFLALYQFIFAIEEPYKILIVRKENGYLEKNKLNNDVYTFEYLISEKEGNGVFIPVKIEENKYDKSEPIIIDHLKEFNIKPMEGLSLKEIEVRRNFEGWNDASSGEVKLMFEDWEQIERTLR